MAYKIFQQLESGMAEKGLVESSEIGYTRNAEANSSRFAGNTVGGELDRINKKLDDIESTPNAPESTPVEVEVDGVTIVRGEDNKLRVNCATDFDGDNTRPAEIGFVKTLVGDIETLLQRL